MSEETTIQHKNRFFGTVILSELFKERKNGNQVKSGGTFQAEKSNPSALA